MNSAFTNHFVCDKEQLNQLVTLQSRLKLIIANTCEVLCIYMVLQNKKICVGKQAGRLMLNSLIRSGEIEQ